VKRVLARLAAVAGSLVVAALLCEVGLRVYGIGGTTEDLSNYAFDPDLGWVPFRSRTMYRSSPYFAHFVHFDADGFPTTEDRVGERADRERPTIALIGDSFTEAFQLPYEQTFAHVVDRSFPDRQVINLGVGGYSPAQYLLSARKRMEGFHVTDVGVFVFPFNDLPYVEHEVYQGHPKPRFDLADLSRPVNTPLDPGETEERARNPLQRLADHSAIYSVLRKFLRGRLFPVDVRPIEPETLRIREDQLRAGLTIVKAIGDEHPDARFFVYFIPVHEELLDAEIRTANAELIERVCGELGLRWYSAADVLLAADDLDGCYIPGDGHFTAAGAARVARHLVEILGEGSEDR